MGFSAGRSTGAAILSIVQPAYDGLNAPRTDKSPDHEGPVHRLIVACDQRAAFDQKMRRPALLLVPPLAPPTVATRREADLPSLCLLAERDTARPLYHCHRFSDAHLLACLVRSPDHPDRLRQWSGLRTNW